MSAAFSYLRKKKGLSITLWSVWTALIFLACFIPGSEVPKVKIPLVDKWVHFLLFAVFSFLWLCAYKTITFSKLLLVFLTSVLLGWMVELIQGSGLVRGRAYEFNDIVADAIGGLIGVVIFYILERRRRT